MAGLDSKSALRLRLEVPSLHLVGCVSRTDGALCHEVDFHVLPRILRAFVWKKICRNSGRLDEQETKGPGQRQRYQPPLF